MSPSLTFTVTQHRFGQSFGSPGLHRCPVQTVLREQPLLPTERVGFEPTANLTLFRPNFSPAGGLRGLKTDIRFLRAGHSAGVSDGTPKHLRAAMLDGSRQRAPALAWNI